MAITTVAGLIAGVVQTTAVFKTSQTIRTNAVPQSYWTAAGNPAPPASYTLALTGAGAIPISTDLGAIPFTNPGSGNTYLQRMTFTNSGSGMVLTLYDRLYHCGSYDLSLNQTNTITAPPALTRPDSTGVDTELWFEMTTVSAASGTPPTIVVNYNNSAGSAFATPSITTSINMVAGQMQPFTLAATDPGSGVRSLASVVTAGGASFTGSFNVIILRRVAQISTVQTGSRTDNDWMQLGFPQIYNNAHLAFMVNSGSATTGNIIGQVELVQG